jgi:UDP-glucose 4-epimerase
MMISQTHFITGGAGFIGSTLADRLLAEGHRICVYDNFSTGQRRFLQDALDNPQFSLIEGDLLDTDYLACSLEGADTVWHFAANADVRFGPRHPRRDLEQNTIATANVLEAMRLTGVRDIMFSSTGSVYGEAAVIPTPEDAPFPVQTSLYGASKAAGEGLIAAYAGSFGMRAAVFRFVSILGERYTHGHVFDFVRQLKDDPSRLPILGDGNQRKSYLYVGDCVEAMLTVHANMPKVFDVYNLGVDGYCTVKDSVGWICAKLGVAPRLEFSGGDRGWIGDNPFIYLDTKKIRALGWSNRLTIREGVEKTVEWLMANTWVFGART